MSTDAPLPASDLKRRSPRIFVLTGIPGAGKSTVGELLAKRFERGVHVAGDGIRAMVVTGRVDMSPRSDSEATAQLLMRYRAAVDVAARYSDGGFDVVIEDVIIGEMLEHFLAMLPWPEVHLVVLNPELVEIVKREEGRSKNAYNAAWRATELHRILREQTSRRGWWIDSTRLTAEETVDAVLAHLDLSAVQLPPSELQP
ncbi:phosphotransferase [Nakamurella sp. A5-74]|uniref:Phosphotransferase n=1 Tax=Nakamurella sp. A5-74 TaxID=3158264 RepID=A0AAU8DMZ1_9ACTN